MEMKENEIQSIEEIKTETFFGRVKSFFEEHEGLTKGLKIAAGVLIGMVACAAIGTGFGAGFGLDSATTTMKHALEMGAFIGSTVGVVPGFVLGAAVVESMEKDSAPEHD